MHMHVHACTRIMCMPAHASTYMRACAHAHARTHTQTHACMRACELAALSLALFFTRIQGIVRTLCYIIAQVYPPFPFFLIDYNFKETTTAHCSVPMLRRPSDEAGPSH